MNIVLIGCGMIGGSMVIDLRHSDTITQVTGIDINEDHLKKSLELNIIDRYSEIDDAVPDAGLVILATPVDVSVEIICHILDCTGEKTVVMDVGSTKGMICAAVVNHRHRQKFVASHPIAGTEDSGPESAFAGLFKNKIALLCESKHSSEYALNRVHDVYSALGSTLIEMGAGEHDRHLAYVSHLSHISAFTLGLTVLDIEKNEQNINLLAGSGFDSTVRLAMSSPNMWGPIFSQNKQDIKTALDEYIRHLTVFRDMIVNDKKEELAVQMLRANDIRRILK